MQDTQNATKANQPIALPRFNRSQGAKDNDQPNQPRWMITDGAIGGDPTTSAALDQLQGQEKMWHHQKKDAENQVEDNKHGVGRKG